MVIEIYENVDIARVTLNGRGMYAARITSQIRILLACIRAAAAAAARNRKLFLLIVRRKPGAREHACNSATSALRTHIAHNIEHENWNRGKRIIARSICLIRKSVFNIMNYSIIVRFAHPLTLIHPFRVFKHFNFLTLCHRLPNEHSHIYCTNITTASQRLSQLFLPHLSTPEMSLTFSSPDNLLALLFYSTLCVSLLGNFTVICWVVILYNGQVNSNNRTFFLSSLLTEWKWDERKTRSRSMTLNWTVDVMLSQQKCLSVSKSSLNYTKNTRAERKN